jgi:NADH-quinone oxidoreductase subunit M
MILFSIILILLAGSLLSWMSAGWHRKAPYFIALIVLLIDLILAIKLLGGEQSSGYWFEEIMRPWIQEWGIQLHLRVDGLSIWLLILTFFIGLISVLCGDEEINERRGFYYFNLLLTLTGVAGVFMAYDLFLFYFFWELMIVPMFCLIIMWGSENRRYAAYKFFLFTQAGGLCMLISILALYFIHYNQTGNYSFDYLDWLKVSLSLTAQKWLLAGFLAAFLVKLPAVVLHTWLPDAHGEAPTAGSVILAGLLLKTGAYGLLRIVLPLFPDAVQQWSQTMMIWGMLGIVYGALLSYAQTDLKRLIAYTSVSHMGFVLLGVFSQNVLAQQGVIMQLLAHGFSTGALFVLAGYLKHRLHHKDLLQMGGFWQDAPVMGFFSLLFVLASLGLPGMANFIAEFFILIGSFQTSRWITVFAATGLVFSAVYSLRIMQKIFFGKKENPVQLSDFKWKETLVMTLLVLPLIFLGLHPKPVMKSAEPVLNEWERKGAIHEQTSSTVTGNATQNESDQTNNYKLNNH